MRLQATFSFFILLQLFQFFTLLVAPSSSSRLSPRPYFLLVPPFLLVTRINPFITDLTKVLRTDQQTDQEHTWHKSILVGRKKLITDQRMDGHSLIELFYRD